MSFTIEVPDDDSGMPKGMVQDPQTKAHAMPSLSKPNVGVLEAMASGAGKKVNDLGAGIKQLLGFASGDSNKELDQRQKFMNAAYAPIKNARPVASAVGEMLPEAALGFATGGGGVVPSMIAGGASAAIPAALEYTEAATPADSISKRLSNSIVVGSVGAAGGAAGGLLTRAIQPMPGAIKGVSDDALNAAKRVGYVPTLGERTQNPLYQNLDNYFERTPGVSTQFRALREANSRAINRSAAGAMGQQSDDLGEATFKAAKDSFTQRYGALNQLAQPDAASPDMMRVLMQLDGANKKAGPFASSAIDDLVNKGLDLASKGTLDGDTYQTIRSVLGKQAESTTDTNLRGALKSVQSALDDAAAASMPADKAAALKELRKEYAAFKTLVKGNVVQDGTVSPQRLASALTQGSNRTGVKTGELNSDLMDIARIGQAFKPPGNPNSGSLMLTEAFNSPLKSALYGSLNYLPGKAYMNAGVQRYLGNNVLPPMLEEGLMRSGAPLSIGGLGYLESNR